jgi:hypothetical protein
MGIFSKLFNKHEASGDGWHFSVDANRGLRQVVFQLGKSSPAKSKFDNLILKPDKYQGLLADLAVGFFKTDSEGGPYLLVKTPGWSSTLSKEAVKIGFTFSHMPSGPVFALFADSPTIRSEVKGACFIDQVYSIHPSDGLVELVQEALSKKSLDVVFADNGGSTGTKCMYDSSYTFEQPLKDVFESELRKLSEYGNNLSGWGQFSFNASRDELYANTPTDKTPILK